MTGDPGFAIADCCPVAAEVALPVFLLPLEDDFFTRDREVAALRYASPAMTKKKPEKTHENATSASDIAIRTGLLTLVAGRTQSSMMNMTMPMAMLTCQGASIAIARKESRCMSFLCVITTPRNFPVL